MAGGRRPSSYISGARHSSGIDRQCVQETITSPPLVPPTGPSLPPWIPSIWQPAPQPQQQQAVPYGPPRTEKNAAVDPSSVLAAALDTAVQSAVERALGGAAGAAVVAAAAAAVSTSQLTASSSNSDIVVEDDASSSSHPVSQREIELHDLVNALKERLHKRDYDVSTLQDRMAFLEELVGKQQQLISEVQRRPHPQSEISELRAAISQIKWGSRKHIEAHLLPMQQQFKETQKLCSQQVHYGPDIATLQWRLNQLSTNSSDFRHKMSTEVDHCASTIKHHGQSLESVTQRVDVLASEAASSNPHIEQLQRSVEAATDSLTSVRSKLKRLEAQVGDVSKHAQDSIALNGAFEESIRAGLDDITKTVSSLHCTVSELKKSLPSDAITSSDKNESRSELASKVDSLEANLKALKRLIESNLRTQWSAESIVKEQVSLITKHVCVAMRQYTARRISENNALIDKALRARIPEYANSDDQFVLVREQDVEGKESVGIHRSPPHDQNQTDS
ncbi:unnamed protein product [Agarophyton chilense]|eukprot:gb/GEZJ01000500.1/.p2 GENE.gb/GEZJ01000500.1/~~gb/GEZJ01000500.1/.p2  ORF type:complete len:506 (-),score=94.56 gb/GEZJ01000500.1/:879-2396(-)